MKSLIIETEELKKKLKVEIRELEKKAQEVKIELATMNYEWMKALDDHEQRHQEVMRSIWEGFAKGQEVMAISLSESFI